MSCSSVKTIYSRLQELCGFRKKSKKRCLEISAPFDFKKETTYLPGISADEISVLREKAAASRIGVVDGPRTPPPHALRSLPVSPVSEASTQFSKPSSTTQLGNFGGPLYSIATEPNML